MMRATPIARAALALAAALLIPAGASAQDPSPLPPNVPPLTDADRAAAFPDVGEHEAHDNDVNFLVLFDQLEWQRTPAHDAASWDTRAWVGRDITRLWVRAEGEVEDRAVSAARAHLLWGRSFARWWDVVAGVRQDFRPGPAQTWAAIGVQGLAPYWFEVEATAYVGASGRTSARVEVEYELLITNRLVLQPLVEADLYGKDDPERRIGAGLSTAGAGLRLRYEFRRELAPYVGVTWEQKFGATGDMAKDDGEAIRSARLAAGLRWWF
jgi:copper resistance protein B